MNRIPPITPESTNAEVRSVVAMLVDEHNARLPKEEEPRPTWSNARVEDANPELPVGGLVRQQGTMYLVKVERGNELLSGERWRCRYPEEAKKYLGEEVTKEEE